jgi:hypothetical protein
LITLSHFEISQAEVKKICLCGVPYIIGSSISGKVEKDFAYCGFGIDSSMPS